MACYYKCCLVDLWLGLLGKFHFYYGGGGGEWGWCSLERAWRSVGFWASPVAKEELGSYDVSYRTLFRCKASHFRSAESFWLEELRGLSGSVGALLVQGFRA